MSVGSEHFLTSLYVHDAFVVRDLEIPIALPRAPRRHLVLTGPNGSGKTAILDGLYAALCTLGSPRARPTRAPLVEPRGAPFEGHDERFVAYMRAGRTLELHQPAGPAIFDERQFLRSEGAAATLLQFLINLRTQQAFAREDGDQPTVERIAARFDALEEHLRRILDDEQARLQLERACYRFRIALGDGRTVGFHELGDGITSLVFMWAALMIPLHGLLRAGIAEPAGWALIDEPELHLHPRLQQMVLPLLTATLPHVQLVVATQSPMVLASLAEATVFGLRSRSASSSADYHGIRYGTILTQHFGLRTDFDLATARKLDRLEELHGLAPAPGTPEHEELHRLLAELRDRPHLLVAQVHKALEFGPA